MRGVVESLAPPSDEAARSAAAVVLTRGLCKNYGSVRALDGLDLAVRRGEVFGLIGPDGAGKTTAFQILSGIMAATSGEVSVLGRAPGEARSRVGYLTQSFSLYQDLSVAENVRYLGELREVPPADIKERGEFYLDSFGMGRFADRLAGRLSGGMKQKLALVCALIAEPEVLLLDEPTTGVDPVSRREFWDTLTELASRGRTIVVATPDLNEAGRCDRVALVYEGRARQTGTPAELRGRLRMRRLEVHAEDLAAAADVLAAREDVADVLRLGDRLDVLVDEAEGDPTDLRDMLRAQGVAVGLVREESPTLENCFVSLLKELRGDAVPPPFPRARVEAPARAPHETAIRARGLTKDYGDFRAVADVDLRINYGEIYGLLGANGAGKTSTIKMLCGLLEPTRGAVEMAGFETGLRRPEARRRIGYMSQKFSLYEDLSVEENLDFYAGVYGVPRRARREKKNWVLAFTGLEGRAHYTIGSLPGGWKQRIAFGACVMHEPEVLFLDEPTSGVDPLARRAFWQLINDFARQGVAVLVTTHYLEEAEQCQRLGFMVSGELAAEGTPSGLKRRYDARLFRLRTSDPRRAAALLRRGEEGWRVSLYGERLHLIIGDDETQAVGRFREELEGAGVSVSEVSEGELSLEDVFIMTARGAEARAGDRAAEA